MDVFLSSLALLRVSVYYPALCGMNSHKVACRAVVAGGCDGPPPDSCHTTVKLNKRKEVGGREQNKDVRNICVMCHRRTCQLSYVLLHNVPVSKAECLHVKRLRFCRNLLWTTVTVR